ncbi:MAG: hypothetical protein J2P15_06690 [Micromonosporaceae bacterium]|nr:hypothetical protein [Micromonosporaceae bacterium]
MYPEQPQGGTPGYDPNQPASPPPAQPAYPQVPAQPAATPTAWSPPPAGYPQQPTSAYPQPASAYPQPASAPPGYPAGYQQQPTPSRPGSGTFVALIVISAVLGIGLIATVAVGLTQMNKLKGDRNTVTAQRDAQKQKDDAAAAQLQQDFTAADLPGKLTKVKQLDKAADTAFHQYEAGSVKFGVLTKAIADCDDAVAAYDQAAAKFPASMLTPKSLPEQIDLNSADTDCGRAFTQNI